MNLYDTIYMRKSIRHYKWKQIPDRLMKMVIKFQNEVQKLDESLQYKLEIVDNLKEHSVIKGAFKVRAPYYLVFYSELRDGYLINAGYILEQIVLYMATKGIGSCYLGGTKVLPTTNADGLKQAVVLAFGLPDEELYRDAKYAKRYQIKELIIFKEEVEDHIRMVLNAARLAPSAFNLQPWRFVAYKNRIHLFSRKEAFLPGNGLRYLDMGIVLFHMMLAIEELWMEGIVIKKEEISERLYKKSEYVTSVFLK